MKNPLFDDYGYYVGPAFPVDCINECSAPGRAADLYVETWRTRLAFSVPRERAIRYLSEFGAWPIVSDEYDTGLRDMDDARLARLVLWLACCDLREEHEWNGLVH